MTDDNVVGDTCPSEVTAVTITVTDEFNPKFDNDTYIGYVPEDASIGFVVIQVSLKLGVVFEILAALCVKGINLEIF